MEFDKNIDDVAYIIYLEIRKRKHFPTIVSKREFLKHKSVFKKDYKLAEISLRGDKINKIINGR